MDDRAADALFILVIAVSIFMPMHMVLGHFTYGILCTVSSLAVTAVIMAMMLEFFRKGSSDGQ